MTNPNRGIQWKNIGGLLLMLAGIFFSPLAQAQTVAGDTVTITINQLEALFLKNNLQLIAQHYNINNAEAQIITARLFQNPQFDISNGLYNTETNKFLDVSQTGGEQSIGLSQVFLTANKRIKGINLAKAGVQQAKYQFTDMIRALKFTLRSDFYTVYFQQKSAKVYKLEINSLSDILSAYKTQYAKGNIAQKELLRIQSQLYSLRAELVNLQVGIDTTQTHIKLMTRLSPNSYIVPRYNYELTGKETLAKVPYQQLLDSAFVNRFDLKYAQATLNYNTLNLQLQKSLAVPDVTFSLAYDKQGSYIKNFTSVGVGVPIPVFNRNQGVIKQARIAIAQSNVAVLSSQQRVESDVSINYKVARTYENTYNTFDPDFRASFTHLIQEVSRNYAKKNISLLSFLDFYDSYKVNSVLLNNVELSRVTSLEQLNFVTGTSFFNQQ